MSRPFLTKKEIPRDPREVQMLRREIQRNTQLTSQAFWREFEHIRNSQRNQLAAETAHRERLTEMMNETNREAQRQREAVSRTLCSHGINPVMRRRLPAPPTLRKEVYPQQLQLSQRKQQQKKQQPEQKQGKQTEKQLEKQKEKQQENQPEQSKEQSEKQPSEKNQKKQQNAKAPQNSEAKPPLKTRTNAKPATTPSPPRAGHTKHLTNLSTPDTSRTPSRNTPNKSKIRPDQKTKK